MNLRIEIIPISMRPSRIVYTYSSVGRVTLTKFECKQMSSELIRQKLKNKIFQKEKKNEIQLGGINKNRINFTKHLVWTVVDDLRDYCIFIYRWIFIM